MYLIPIADKKNQYRMWSDSLRIIKNWNWRDGSVFLLLKLKHVLFLHTEFPHYTVNKRGLISAHIDTATNMRIKNCFWGLGFESMKQSMSGEGNEN